MGVARPPGVAGLIQACELGSAGCLIALPGPCTQQGLPRPSPLQSSGLSAGTTAAFCASIKAPCRGLPPERWPTASLPAPSPNGLPAPPVVALVPPPPAALVPPPPAALFPHPLTRPTRRPPRTQHPLLQDPPGAVAGPPGTRPCAGPERHHREPGGVRPPAVHSTLPGPAAGSGRHGVERHGAVPATPPPGVPLESARRLGALPVSTAPPPLHSPPAAGVCRLEPSRAAAGGAGVGWLGGRGKLRAAGGGAGPAGGPAPRAVHLRRMGLWGPAMVAGVLQGAVEAACFLRSFLCGWGGSEGGRN